MKRILLAMLLVTILVLSVTGCMLLGKTYTVTFDADGGSAVESQEIKEGEKATAPADPTKEGYTFAGWYAGETAYDFGAAVTADVALKAKWTLNTYTVTFDADNGTEKTTATVGYGSAVEAPAVPEKAGYTFAGWLLGETAYDFATAVKSDIALKAAWTVNQYTITFDTDGGSAIAPIVLDFGVAVTAPAAPTKEGYTFAGWDKEIPATMPIEGVTVKALWEINKYTVTFDADNDTKIVTVTVNYGASVTKIPNPEKAGYTFAGWLLGEAAYDFTTVVKSDIALTAAWTINQYTITFDTDGGSEIASIVADFGAPVTAPAAPTKEGYTFAGWDKDIPATMPVEDVTIKALWTVNQYTITFDTNGGSEIAPITLDFGAAVTAPAAPTKLGHLFAGWDKVIPATMPAENVTIKAAWTINQYTITFDTDGGSEIAPIKQNYATAIVAPASPTKEGYTFAGWDKTIPATMPAENVTVKALWTLNEYVVTFDAANGTGIISVPVKHGETVTVPANPTKEGHTFGGWYNGEIAFDASSAVTCDLALTALWTTNSYTVIINADNGSDSVSYLVEYGKTVAAPADPTKVGYTFKGWFVDGVEYDFATPITGILTIKAAWTVNQYTITFDTDGGSAIDPITLDFGATVTAPAAPTKEGYTFKGWDKEIPATMPAENVTVKASWTLNTYTVIFNADNNTLNKNVLVNHGATVEAIADPVMTGYIFEGWFIGDNKYDFATPVTGELTLTAKWTKITYTVTVDTANGAEASTQVVDFGGVAVLPEGLTKPGFKFVGWTLNGEAYDVTAVVTGNITIVAVWEVDLPDLTEIAGTWTGDETVGYTDYPYEFVIAANGVITASYNNGYTDVPLTVNYVLFENNVLTINYNAGSVEGANLVFTLSDDKGSLAAQAGVMGTAVTLYKTFTVTFDWGNYKSEVDPTTKTVSSGSTVTAPSQSWTGYEIKAWYLNGEVFDLKNTPITSDITLVAEWGPKMIKVTFYGQDGTTPIKEFEVPHSTTIKEIADQFPTEVATTDGFKFNGKWYTSLTSTNPQKTDSTSKITSEKKFYPGLIAPMNDIAGTWTGPDSKGNAYTMVVDAANQTVAVTIVNSDGTTECNITSVYYKDPAKMVIRYTVGEGTSETILTLTYTAEGTFTASNNLILKNTYTVTFDSDGGSAVEAQTIAKGEAAQEPAAPTKDGYTFKGWTLNGEAYDFATPVTGNITLTATWEEIVVSETYTVTFDTDGGSAVEAQTIAKGATAQEPVAPTKDGYTFKGWTLNGEAYDFATPVTGEITLTAKWEVAVPTYTVTFDSAEGSAVDAQTIKQGETAQEPTAPTKDGYTFAGWYNGETLYDFATPVTGDITLVAKWEEVVPDITYIVIFKKGTTTVDTQEVAAGECAVAPADPTASGKIFMGWFDGETKFDPTTPINSDFTFVAKWGYEVTFYTLNGVELKKIVVEENTPIPAEEYPEAVIDVENYIFNGYWHKGTTTSAAPVRADIDAVTTKLTLYPGAIDQSIIDHKGTWACKKGDNTHTFIIDVSVDGNGVVIGANVTYILTEGDVSTSYKAETILYKMNSSNYMQLYIKYRKDQSKPNLSTLTVNYKEGNLQYSSTNLTKVVPHTVIFKKGTTTVDTQEVLTFQYATAPADPTASGKIFMGWFDGETKFDPTTPINSDFTFVAKWGYEVIFYSLSGVELKKIVVEEKTPIPAEEYPEAVIDVEGYIFNGYWHKATNSTAMPVRADIDAVTTKLTLYPGAIDQNVIDHKGTWSCIKSEKVYTFNIDVAVDENGKATGVAISFTLDGISYEAETILYKMSSSDYMQFSIRYRKNGVADPTLGSLTVNYKEGNLQYSSTNLVKDTGESKGFVVTFNTDGGSAIEAQTVATGEVVTAPVVPTKEGYTFAGWYLDDAPYNFETPVTADITLVAKWEAAA